MNILRQEFRQGFKPFIFWVLGIAFLILGGMVKFLGLSGAESGSIVSMFQKIPKPVLAVFGMAEVNIETFGGFYAVLQYYALIAISSYAIHLGTGSVLRESIDKTYEFLFTRPRSKIHILSMKLLSGFIWLTLLCALNGIFSYLAPPLYHIENTLSDQMPLFFLAHYLTSLWFFSLSAMLSTLITEAEQAIQLSYTVLLVSFMISVIFDIDPKFEFLRRVTPFKYFRASELLNGQFNMGYASAILIMTILFMTIACLRFRQKDLSAV